MLCWAAIDSPATLRRGSMWMPSVSSAASASPYMIQPPGVYADLEDALEQAYGLREAQVFDIGDDQAETDIVRELGRLVAPRLQAGLLDAEVIGFTSWSRTFREAVRAMEPTRQPASRYVVEMLGDVGPPQLQHETSEVTRQLASLTGAKPVF